MFHSTVNLFYKIFVIPHLWVAKNNRSFLEEMALGGPLYPRAKLLGAVGYPPRISRKGKTPPLERGRGRHSPPVNPERVTAKALKRGDKGVLLPW